MAGDTKTRGPMSEDARILLAKRKFAGLDSIGRIAAREILKDKPSITEATAKRHDDIASLVRISGRLTVEGVATLLKLVE